MKAAIVTIGDEILIGQVQDTNSSWLAENLSLLGIAVTEIVSISDSRNHIIVTLDRLISQVDLIIMTGGLGPTRDDITKNTLADYFHTTLEINEDVLQHIKELFRGRGMRLSQVNENQAMVPVNCKVLKNPSGTAPGMWFEKEKTIFVSVPGVPYEMKDIFNQSLLPELSKKINGLHLVHKTVMTQGIPESYLAETIKDWELALPENIKLAYLPRPGIVRLRLTGAGEDPGFVESTINSEIEKLRSILRGDIFSLKDEPLENVIAELLTGTGKTLVTAESCTGGNIAKLITSVPGSSIYFKGSIIAYSNELKTSKLGVDPRLIETYGAVSREVVEQMAVEGRKYFNADYSVATSGIAGPGGGTDEKPVGMTWISVSTHRLTLSKKFNFGEHRGRNIEKASYAALNMLRKIIMEISEEKNKQ